METSPDIYDDIILGTNYIKFKENNSTNYLKFYLELYLYNSRDNVFYYILSNSNNYY